MKNFKEFIKNYEDGNFTYNDKTLAYAAYCQGYAEAKSEIAVSVLRYADSTFARGSRKNESQSNLKKNIHQKN